MDVKREPWYAEVRPEITDPLDWEWGYLEQNEQGGFTFTLATNIEEAEIVSSHAFHVALRILKKKRQ